MYNATILWCNWSGYMDACAKAMAADPECRLTIVYRMQNPAAPYDISPFFQYPCSSFMVDAKAKNLPAAACAEPPDVLVVCGWHVPAYRKYARSLRGRTTRILCLDNQWHGTLRQRIGALISPFYILPAYDYGFAPGARQEALLRHLHFPQSRCRQGHYACDYDRFSPRYAERQARPLQHSFMFIGRLVASKGIDVLLEAWQRLNAGGPHGWTLKLVGTGPALKGKELPAGVELCGFVQPSALSEKMLEADVFVLPSIFEPWGLVLHETAATGMPIICTQACGGGDAFLRDGKNGYLVPTGSVDALHQAFEKITRMSEDTLRSMGAYSVELSGQRTPASWAAQIVSLYQKAGLRQH